MAQERDVKTPPKGEPPAGAGAAARPAPAAAAGGDGAASKPETATAERYRAIEGWRDRIDTIDTQLMSLLNSRSACAVEIGRIKRELGLPVYSPEREAFILDRVERENPGPLDSTAVRRVFERVIDESRRLERIACEAETRRNEGKKD
jgi:chorismate mutase